MLWNLYTFYHFEEEHDEKKGKDGSRRPEERNEIEVNDENEKLIHGLLNETEKIPRENGTA